MYVCPKRDQDWHQGPAPQFKAEYVQTGYVPLDAKGERNGLIQPETMEWAPETVRCAFCKARAEWVDRRQVELFPVAPTLEDTLQ